MSLGRNYGLLPSLKLPALILASALFASATIAATEVQTLRFCIDHYPPNHIFPNELPENHPKHSSSAVPIGFAVNATEEIAQQLALKLDASINTPFKRCLGLMKRGETDLMWGLLGNPERESYMYLFEYAGTDPRQFLIRKNSPFKINELEDLRGLMVGVVQGYKYFPEFDSAKEVFSRWRLNDIKQGVRMLLLERIDTLIIREQIYADVLKNDPTLAEKLAVADYRYEQERPVYIGLSKNSPLATKRIKIQHIIREMLNSGRLDEIRAEFNHDYYGNDDKVSSEANN